MKSKQILFFATSIDLIEIIKSMEATTDIIFYEMGLFNEPSITCYKTVSEIPNFGICVEGDWNKDRRFLVMPATMPLKIREIPQRKGGIKYAVDALENQVSICFQFGGIFQDNALIPGSCDATFLTDFSEHIFKFFSLKVKRDFKKIEGYYVGKDGLEKLQLGWRLVTNVKLSKDFDLKRI